MIERLLRSIVRGVVKSFGVKRKVSSLLVTIYGLTSTVPELAAFSTVILQIAAYLGIAGVGHAAASSNLGKLKLSSVTSLLGALLYLSGSIPQLAPFAPLLAQIAAYFGITAVTLNLTSKK